VIPLLFGCNLIAGKWRKMPLKAETERRLLERYRGDIELTSAMIGRNLDLWLEPRQATSRAA
jgi:hypothetical protein